MTETPEETAERQRQFKEWYEEAQQKASDMAYKLGDLKIAVEEALKELREEHPAQRILEDAMKASNGG